METPEWGTLVEAINDDSGEPWINGVYATGERTECLGGIRVCRYKDPLSGQLYDYIGVAPKWRYPGETEWRT